MAGAGLQRTGVGVAERRGLALHLPEEGGGADEKAGWRGPEPALLNALLRQQNSVGCLSGVFWAGPSFWESQFALPSLQPPVTGTGEGDLLF